MASIASRGSAATGYTLDTLLLFRSHRFEWRRMGREGETRYPDPTTGTRGNSDRSRKYKNFSIDTTPVIFFFFSFLFYKPNIFTTSFYLTRDGNRIAAYFDHRALCITTSFKYSMKNEIARTRFIIDLIYNVENCIENFTSV